MCLKSLYFAAENGTNACTVLFPVGRVYFTVNRRSVEGTKVNYSLKLKEYV